jgi:hypothetical protein
MMALVEEILTDAKTGKVTKRLIDVPLITLAQAQANQVESDRQDANGQSLVQQADSAIQSLRDYRDLVAPSNAQTVAAVKLLCRVAIALIRLQLRKFDRAD